MSSTRKEEGEKEGWKREPIGGKRRGKKNGRGQEEVGYERRNEYREEEEYKEIAWWEKEGKEKEKVRWKRGEISMCGGKAEGYTVVGGERLCR